MLSTPVLAKTDYSKIYEPAEDSFLLLDLFESHRPVFESTNCPLVVELGTGSGIVSTFLNQHILKNAIFIATDINPHCCRAAILTNSLNASTGNFDSVQTDLVAGLRPQTIDMLVFNPPYVPSPQVPGVPGSLQDDSWLDLALDGGEDGMQITNKVLDALDSCLASNGKAYILFCARNKPETVVARFTDNHPMFSVEKLIERKAGWEVLSIYLFQKNSAK